MNIHIYTWLVTVNGLRESLIRTDCVFVYSIDSIKLYGHNKFLFSTGHLGSFHLKSVGGGGIQIPYWI